LLRLRGHQSGAGDVRRLGSLVATAEQDDQDVPTAYEVHAISWSIIDPQLPDPIEEFGVAEQSRLKTHDTLGNPFPCSLIPEGGESVTKLQRLPNFNHL